FAGTTPRYDSPSPCTWGLSLIAFPHRPPRTHQRTADSVRQRRSTAVRRTASGAAKRGYREARPAVPFAPGCPDDYGTPRQMSVNEFVQARLMASSVLLSHLFAVAYRDFSAKTAQRGATNTIIYQTESL